jgi:hypothetical protein
MESSAQRNNLRSLFTVKKLPTDQGIRNAAISYLELLSKSWQNDWQKIEDLIYAKAV